MLKQISIKNRTLFLEQFTQELILNSKPQVKIVIPKITIKEPRIEEVHKLVHEKEKVKKEIKNTLSSKIFYIPDIIKKIEDKLTRKPSIDPFSEQITQEIGTEEVPKEEEFKNIPISKEFSLPDIKEIEKKLIEKHITEPLPKSITQEQNAKSDFSEMKYSSSIKYPLIEPPPSKIIHPVAKIEPKIKKPHPLTIKKRFTTPSLLLKKPLTPLPIVAPPPDQKIDLGKLNILTTDSGITTIECPGPEKFILVKKVGRVNITSITLSQEEINKVIYDFSEKARIPVIGGPFKAIIGDLSLNAITTDSVGNRFIIYNLKNTSHN